MAALSLALSWPVAFASPVLAQEQGQCLSKREIQQRIESGQFRQLSEAIDHAGIRGKIIGAGRVCRAQGEWQWQISVMDNSGGSQVVNLPAR